jgi:hypothetical protein
MSEPLGGRIELADLISTLRDELDLAQQRARNTSPQFTVQWIDLEVSFRLHEGSGGERRREVLGAQGRFEGSRAGSKIPSVFASAEDRCALFVPLRVESTVRDRPRSFRG